MSNTDKKKTYRKPEVRAIDLVADEVLTTGCKTETGTGGITDQCLIPAACSSDTGS